VTAETIEITLEVGDEVFTHSSEGTFNIGGMKRVLAQLRRPPVRGVRLSPDLVEHCRRNDPNAARVAALKLSPAGLAQPVIVMAKQIDAKTVQMHVLDGTHRLLARAELGLATFDAYAFTHDEAQWFRIDHLAPAMVIRDKDTRAEIQFFNRGEQSA
jgi:hypothetical protein